MHSDPNQPSTNTASPRAGAEYCTLPVRGGDPFCGLSRRWWYEAEKLGYIRLIRVRLPGRKLGRVLLPFAEALACVAKLKVEAERLVSNHRQSNCQDELGTAI